MDFRMVSIVFLKAYHDTRWTLAVPSGVICSATNGAVIGGSAYSASNNRANTAPAEGRRGFFITFRNYHSVLNKSFLPEDRPIRDPEIVCQTCYTNH